MARRRLQLWWRAVQARLPNLSTCVLILFVLATVGPWIGYEQIAEADRKEQLASAAQNLELLATLYGEWAIRLPNNGQTGSGQANPQVMEWVRTLPKVGKASLSIRPITRFAPQSGAERPHPGEGPQTARIFQNNGVVTAEVDFPGDGIVAAASLSDADVVAGWMSRSLVSQFIMGVRAILIIAIGYTLFRQLRWREITQAELIRTRAAAELANRAKSEFLANMSHELRTPLNAIIGFSEAIKLGMFGPVSERYREYGGNILNSGTHLLQLVNDLLDLSKLEAGRLELDEAEIDISTVIGAALHLVQPLAVKAKVTVRKDICPGLPRVRGDARRLQQAVLNLSANAVKFTPPGGVVCVSACEDQNQLLIRVSDTGIGMTRDQIPRAFEPFRQVNGRFGRKQEGTGLGLPIAKDMVELHGGRLTIDSEVGVGTTATISLPRGRILPVPRVRAAAAEPVPV